MAHSRKRNSIIGIVAFILFVGITGYALAASGNMSNPFSFLTQGGGRERGGDFGGGRDGGQFAPPSTVQSNSATTTTTDSGLTPPVGFAAPSVPPTSDAASSGTSFQSDRGERGFPGEGGFASSQVGGVLFNLWFICAITAVVVVLQQSIDFIRRRMRRYPQRTAAA